jgi:predicted secreted hydrolase
MFRSKRLPTSREQGRRALAARVLGCALVALAATAHGPGAAMSETRPSPAAPVSFPKDLYDHQNEQGEWWYYTGNLIGTDAHRYGFELTFFRSIVPTGLPAGQPQTVPVIFADLGISDLDGHRHYFHKSLSELPSSTAGIVERPWSIFLNGWSVHQPSSVMGVTRLEASQDGNGIDLFLRPDIPPVVNGKNGLFVLDGSDGQGDETYKYYSYPRLFPSGLLRFNGKTVAVSGIAWSDHEFFTLGAKQGFPGWDWFSIHLADGSELMLYGLRLPDGRFDPASRGTYVSPSGGVTHLEPGDFTLTPGRDSFHSAATGATYPIAWDIAVPRENIRLHMTTPLADQEMPEVSGGGSPTYWEGASEFVGTKDLRPISGVGYLEMLGY